MNTSGENAIVRLDVRNLRRPLDTLQPMQLCNFRVKFTGVPSDAASMSVVIYNAAGDNHFEPVMCNRDDNGDWYADIIGACFPVAGEVKYQVAMYSAEGGTYAGGVGKAVITAFDPIAGGMPLPSGGYAVTSIYDDYGNPHTVKAVLVDGEWTWRMED